MTEFAAEQKSQLIVNTQWFTRPAFAGPDFAAQFHPLPNKPCCTLLKLPDFIPKEMDIVQLQTLLYHLDLVHGTAESRFLMPEKLPTDDPEIDWDTQEAFDVKGKSIEGVKDIDIINPIPFLSVLKILDSHRGSANVSRFAVKYTIGSPQVFVKLTKHERPINIAVMCPDKDSRSKCLTKLTSVQLIQLICQLKILERSQGTNVRENYISHRSIKVSKNLEDLITFSRDDLTMAEGDSGVIESRGKPEEITNILFQGCDDMFLQELGAECRYEWLPTERAKMYLKRLDKTNEWGEDYRAVGKALGIQECDVDNIVEENKSRQESTTANIIRKWCKKQSRKMTIAMLQTLFQRLSLVPNEDALKAVDEILQKVNTNFWLC